MARFFILASFFSFFISIRAMAQLTSSSPMAYSTDSSTLVFNLSSAPLGSNAGAFTGPDGRETAEFATTINNCKPSQLLATMLNFRNRPRITACLL